MALLLLPQVSEILDIMKWRMATARTVRVDTDIEWRGWKTVTDSKGKATREPESVRVTTSGLVDRSDRKETKQTHLFRTAIGSPDPAYLFEGEFRRLGKDNHLRLDKVPEDIGTFRLDRFSERWLQLELADVLEAVDLPLIGGGRPLSDESRAYLADQFRMTPFISVVNRLQNDMLGDKTLLHYEVRPEVLFFKDFYMTEEKLRRDRELTEDERYAIDRFFANIQPEIGEMWIGRDYYLYRLRLRFRYDDGLREGVLSMQFDFSHFNEPVLVGPPEGEVEDVKEIIDSLLPNIVNKLPMAAMGGQRIVSEDGWRGGLGAEGVEQDPDPDGDGLSNTLEFFYGSDPENPDTDGDGVSDGEEVEKGMNPNGPGGLFDFGLEALIDETEDRTDPQVDSGQ
jgi:hypothetical protein